MFWSILKTLVASAATAACLYAGLLLLLTTHFFQRHVVYLHAFQMTGSKDLNVPEMFGFLRGQVTPFLITSEDGSSLHSWHILPVGVYAKHETELASQPAGLSPEFTSSLAFKLLRDDPEALLVIHFHGAGGNIGSGYRVPNYKALSAAAPDRVHVLTFDYRGFGRSPGSPSEEGLLQDATAVVEWALTVAKIPPSRILFFGQSLGTAVNIAMAEKFASLPKPITFAGHILVAPFLNVPTLVATYKVAGTVPILSPVAKYPWLFEWLKSYIREDWASDRRLEAYIRRQEAAGRKYRITMIHAEDDYDIPHHHTSMLMSRAINATQDGDCNAEKIEEHRRSSVLDYAAAGSVTTRRTANGIITERILKYGLHDVVMGDPTITLAATRIFGTGGKS